MMMVTVRVSEAFLSTSVSLHPISSTPAFLDRRLLEVTGFCQSPLLYIHSGGRK